MSPLKSNWLASPPSSRLRVGRCTVDVPLREIVQDDGVTSRVTLKSIAVLLVLAENAGNVVSREFLLASVWAGTMPTLDVVTQAVASLRKALGGEGDTPGYVETIPKTGYRLLAEVEWLPAGSKPTLQSTRDRAPGSRWRPLAGVAAALALLATLSWSMAGWRDPAPSASPSHAPPAGTPVEVGYTLLTSRPGWEVEPALSPDGASVAYAMSPDGSGKSMAIFVQSTQPTPPRQLTTPPHGYTDGLPRWSPDGRQLMFARFEKATDACSLRLLPASGGPERVVGSCDRFSGPRYDWLPDGSGIVAGLKPAEGETFGPLSILRLESGQWQPMNYAVAEGNADFDPRFSSDGSRLGFRRNLSRSDIWVMPAQGGVPQQVTHMRGDIRGWDWSPDDRQLLLSLGNGGPRLVRHDVASGRSVMLGRVRAVGLDVSALAGNMVFVVNDMRLAIFRYPLPLGDGGPPQPLFPSTGADLLPSPSPDGRMLAFLSDRSREMRLWIGELENADSLRMVDGFAPIAKHPPQWSSDGERLFVIGEPTDPAQPPGPRLYEVDVASGRVHAMALEGIPYFAQPLPGNRLLASVDLGSGMWTLRILDLASPGNVLAEMADVGEARFDPATAQVYFVKLDTPGLWRTGLDLASPTLLDGEQPAVYWQRHWALLEGKPFWLVDSAPGCASPWRWMGRASGTVDAGCFDRKYGGQLALALVPSRDGDWVYATMMTEVGNGDIGMLQLDRAGATR